VIPVSHQHSAATVGAAKRAADRGVRLLGVLVLCAVVGLPALATDGGGAKPPSPDLVLRTLDGTESLQLKDLRGHPVLLSFWASWCGPCREELPKLAELAMQLGDDGFFLVAVNVDQVPAVGLEFLKRYKISVPAFQVNRGELGLMGIDGLPTNILLDRDGNVVKVFKGFEPTLIDEIRQLLETMRPVATSPADGS
jgi:cytochrome c biogenesis protein CcmG/thiol:disulfide interchange protein DsbE